jgi:hypothetical protein
LTIDNFFVGLRPEAPKEEIAASENPGVDFFRRMTRLRDLGLFEWAPHLVESAEETGEIIHPLRMGGSDNIEDAQRTRAGKALIIEGQYDWAVKNGIHQLVPVPRYIANVDRWRILEGYFSARGNLVAPDNAARPAVGSCAGAVQPRSGQEIGL